MTIILLEADELENQEEMQRMQAQGGGQMPQLNQEALDELYSQANPQAMEMIQKGLQQ